MKNRTIKFGLAEEGLFWRGEAEFDKKELIGDFYFCILVF